MKQQILCLALSLGILAAVLASNPGRPVAAAGSAPVLVTNTTAQSVPTSAQGTTAIAGTVQAVQSGVWSVSITGNTATNPLLVRDVDNAANQSIQFALCTDFGSLAGGCSAPAEEIVPAVAANGAAVRRMVVEYIAGECKPVRITSPTYNDDHSDADGGL